MGAGPHPYPTPGKLIPPSNVVDLMHDNEDSLREIYGADFEVVGRYIPRPPLERAVKAFWRKQMLAAIKAGSKA
jgi:hypothetical protein